MIQWEQIKAYADGSQPMESLEALIANEALWQSDSKLLLRLAGCSQLNKQHDTAIRIVDAAFQRRSLFTEDSILELLYIKSDALHDLERYTEAIDVYSEIIKIKPCDCIYSNRALAYCECNLLEQAVADYTSAIALNPNNTIALSNCGALLTEMERYTEAIPLLEKSISLDANDALAYRDLGIAYYNNEDEWTKVYQALNKALQLNPTDRIALLGIKKLKHLFDLDD